jgi:hypothetical protein
MLQRLNGGHGVENAGFVKTFVSQQPAPACFWCPLTVMMAHWPYHRRRFPQNCASPGPVRSWLLPWYLPPRCPVLSMSFPETIDIIYVHIMLAWLSGCRHGVDLRPLPGMNLLRDDGMRDVHRRSFRWLPHDPTIYVWVVREGRQRRKKLDHQMP